jgi:hypothetical protein
MLEGGRGGQTGRVLHQPINRWVTVISKGVISGNILTRGLTTCEGTAIPSGKKCADTGDRGQSARIGSNRSPSVWVAVATWKEGRTRHCRPG